MSKILNCASPTSPRDADQWRMFWYLQRRAVFLAAFVGFWFIESAYPQGDSRNLGALLHDRDGAFGRCVHCQVAT
jgi:hypothetical protein